jgi:signal transduction histidine kinase/ActR/RegA family two-component response regulator
MSVEERILVFTPTGRDAELIRSNLRDAGVASLACQSWSALENQYRVGAGGILLSEEVLQDDGVSRLQHLLQEQPAWSDLPVMLLVGRKGDTAAMHAATRPVGNVTLLERPMRVAALMSAVEYALRSRRRQYESRQHLLALERAADDLSQSERQLREAHARKDQFLATLAHELRNPLAPIRNAMHILKRKAADPTLAPLHDIIERQLGHLVRLVDDLLEVSRITRGKVSLHLEQLDIASILRGAIETSRPLIDAARHELQLQLPAESIQVRGDAVRLAQVFSNLLNNAAKYTEDGGCIRVSVRPEGDEVVVSIEDNGIGIEPAMLDSVFDIFTQVRDADARAQGGLGIGLTLVRSLVGLHGGRVMAHSAGRNEGSTFSVYLPIESVSANQARSKSETLGAAPSLTGRVIVVDDNRDAADTLSMALRQHGAEVQTTYCAEDALGVLKPDVDTAVIADLGMPEVDGFELARRIRSSPGNSRVRLIALSGWGQVEDRARAEAAGFDCHFTKPADIEELIAAVSPSARKAASRRNLSR